MKSFRYRSLFLWGGALIAGLGSWFSDPDFHHLSTILGGLSIVQGVWAVAAAHWTRKALMDYGIADQKKLFEKASEHPVGAAIALLALAIIFVGLLMVFSPRAQAEEIPKGFFKYGSLLKKEQQNYWPNHPDPAILAALIEQESCISIRSHGCWNPSAQLKTAREEGIGMGQITRAYHSDGSLRFDTLADLKKNM